MAVARNSRAIRVAIAHRSAGRVGRLCCLLGWFSTTRLREDPHTESGTVTPTGSSLAHTPFSPLSIRDGAEGQRRGVSEASTTSQRRRRRRRAVGFLSSFSEVCLALAPPRRGWPGGRRGGGGGRGGGRENPPRASSMENKRDRFRTMAFRSRRVVHLNDAFRSPPRRRCRFIKTIRVYDVKEPGADERTDESRRTATSRMTT